MFGMCSDQQARVSAAIQFIAVLKSRSSDAESFREVSLDEKETVTRDAALDMLKEYFEQRPKERDDAPALLTLSQIEEYVKERLGERERVAEQASK